MRAVNDVIPSPGEALRTALEERGMSQKDLAFILGVPVQVVNYIVTNKRRVTPEISKALGEVFAVAPDHFLTMELEFQLSLAREPEPAVVRRAKMLAAFPVRKMIARGWLQDDADTLESQVTTFFGLESVEESPALAHAAYKSAGAAVTPEQLAWLYRVKQLAEEMLVAPFDDFSAKRAVDKLDGLLLSAEEARKVPRILAESGIRFALVEQIPGAKIDGACFWLNERAPVIGLSMRYDRIDNFWFVLRHELEHVRLRHGMESAMVDAELEGERAGTGASVAEEERCANAAAADFCVPQHKLKDFIARKAPLFTERNVVAFARTINVHPGLVAGQLQRHTGRYDLSRKHQVKIRSIVARGATVDGWGDVAQTGD